LVTLVKRYVVYAPCGPVIALAFQPSQKLWFTSRCSLDIAGLPVYRLFNAHWAVFVLPITLQIRFANKARDREHEYRPTW